MKSQIKAVFFDIDGTLFDRHSAQRQIYHAFKKEYASLFDDIDDFMLMAIYYEAERLGGEYFHTGNDNKLIHLYQFQMFLTMLGQDDSYAQKMADFYVEQYVHTKSEIPDARAVVERLAGQYQVGVITNGPSQVQRNKLVSLGIHRIAQSVIISDEVGLLKPDPNIFQKAAGELGLATEECLYVGNTYDHDIKGGSDAGMLTCWYNPSRNTPDDKIKPDYQIRKLSELYKILL